jgi:DNA-binding response OmpR family regulator
MKQGIEERSEDRTKDRIPDGLPGRAKDRILVVDDDRLVADTLTLIFQANGFDSEAVYSAADGLTRARTFHPALLLCDITMPEESGLQLAQKIDAELPHCKLLMLTAYASNYDHVERQNLSMRRPLKMLKKPCRPELLLSEASALLETA